MPAPVLEKVSPVAPKRKPKKEEKDSRFRHQRFCLTASISFDYGQTTYKSYLCTIWRCEPTFEEFLKLEHLSPWFASAVSQWCGHVKDAKAVEEDDVFETDYDFRHRSWVIRSVPFGAQQIRFSTDQMRTFQMPLQRNHVFQPQISTRIGQNRAKHRARPLGGRS